ncbi:uncharacterized protein LAESUDRAFT_782067 [Laetiporus sulphureus 93-53]|uniref:F-box domain-containing protein n=1 Tax=Laetiporus sulphureus 93-53 TaxID=1314785 RepID=A0A165DI93_9APHY|nr:uncharacterized protein LAESUDRAFT_782067 [Laetiporus sulphureus 93-53]KZT04941.1 hypothetical protein LAESUDRAFT_782067 [Laetiporus sulphureus 93-53]
MLIKALPVLPADVWENVIDHIRDNSNALTACTLVCRTWYPRSRFYLLREVWFHSQGDVRICSRMLKKTPQLSKRVEQMIIQGSAHLGEQKPEPVPHLSTAAMMLARKVPRLKKLSIWQTSTIHRDTFLHLFAFTSISHLNLASVMFPSIAVFGLLICALRSLIGLDCWGLTFMQGTLNSTVFGAHRDPVKIRELSLNGTGLGEVIKFFVSTGIGSSSRF